MLWSDLNSEMSLHQSSFYSRLVSQAASSSNGHTSAGQPVFPCFLHTHRHPYSYRMQPWWQVDGPLWLTSRRDLMTSAVFPPFGALSTGQMLESLERRACSSKFSTNTMVQGTGSMFWHKISELCLEAHMCKASYKRLREENGWSRFKTYLTLQSEFKASLNKLMKYNTVQDSMI